jgi:hypothetical protein
MHHPSSDPKLAPVAPVSLTVSHGIPESVRTPVWHASRVLRVTASDWWEDGIPPSRKRRAQQAANQLQQRAAQQVHAAAAVATAAFSSVSNGLHSRSKALRRLAAPLPTVPALSGRLSAA